MEVFDGTDASDVEDVLPDAEIAGLGALATRDMGESVFDRDALSELVAAVWARLESSELDEEALVRVDGYGAPVPGLGSRAAIT
jgi:hypothetical protein